MSEQPPAAPAIIQPQPGPCQTLVQQGQLADGRACVILTLVTVTGSTTVFLPPEGALNVGAELTRTGRAAKAGLFLPGAANGHRLPHTGG